MTKYYKVWLNEDMVGYKSQMYRFSDDNYIICKRSINTYIKDIGAIFREIITNKIVYPSSDTKIRGLTYDIVCEIFWSEKRIIAQYKEITASEVQEWLKNMDEESLKAYVEKINKLEAKAIECYDEEKHKKLEEKEQNRNASKSIKRTLRKIR